MSPEYLKTRTKLFAINVLHLCKRIPKTEENNVIKHQLAKSGTSVGANYRAACRARSQNEFISKICIVNEEADESAYWLEIIREAGILNDDSTRLLQKEANELNAIFTAASNTARRNRFENKDDKSSR